MTDRITAPMRKASNNIAGFNRKMQNSFNGLNRTIDRTNKKINKMAKSRVATAGMAGLAVGVAVVTKQFVQFDDAITGAAARFKDINVQTEAGKKQMDLLRKSARDAGATTEKNAVEAAKALDFFARAGFTSQEAMMGLTGMIDLATASGEDFAQVADMSSDLLGAFGLAVEDSGQKMKNLGRLNDVLVKAANTANVTVGTMFETMKVAAPIATKYGASLEEVAAMTAIMGNAGIKGSQGATALKNTFTRLAAPTKDVRKGLKAVGLSADDLVDKAGNMKKLTTILKNVRDGMEGMGTGKQLAVMKQIFGSFAIAGGANLLSSIKNIEKFEGQMLDAGGTAKKTAEFMRQSLGNQIKGLGSAATEMGFKFLDAFKGDASGGIQSLTKSIRTFDVGPIVSGLKLVFFILKIGFTILKPFIPLLLALIVVTKLYVIAMTIAGNAQKLWAGIMMLWSKRAKAMMVITKLQTVGQWLYNAAMIAWNFIAPVATTVTGALGAAFAFLTSPIALVILAIAALIAIVVLVVKFWRPLGTFFSGLWSGIKSTFSATIDWIMAAFDKLWKWVTGIWDSISSVFSSASDTADKTANLNVNGQGGGFRSPNTTETTTTNNSVVDINVNAPKGTTAKKRGKTAQGTTLNLGLNPI